MRIRFIKDYKDHRENRYKVFRKGKTIICDKSFGEVVIKSGSAVEFEPVNILDEIKKSENKSKLKNVKENGNS